MYIQDGGSDQVVPNLGRVRRCDRRGGREPIIVNFLRFMQNPARYNGWVITLRQEQVKYYVMLTLATTNPDIMTLIMTLMGRACLFRMRGSNSKWLHASRLYLTNRQFRSPCPVREHLRCKHCHSGRILVECQCVILLFTTG